MRIRAVITVGDPAGIGPLIIPRALKALKGLADFTVIGDCSRKVFRPGKMDRECGRVSVSYLEEGFKLLKSGEADCLITGPVSKEAVNLAGFSFKGHTEYLAEAAGVRSFAMCLLNKRLKISLVTTHEPISRVASLINQERVSETIRLTMAGLKGYFGIPKPKIAVMGLNPHASDNGVLGDEEAQIIRPALKQAEERLGIPIYGPLPADVAVAKALNKEFDALIGMYHDQALIALKATDSKSGVNLTLGLPFVRTSPLHGTAFDIALNPKAADPSSMIAAIKAAVKCAYARRKG